MFYQKYNMTKSGKIFLVLYIFLLFIYINSVLAIGSGGGGYMPPKFRPSEQKQLHPIQEQKQPKDVDIRKPATPLNYKNVICNNLKNIKERVGCRLNKTENELKKEPFLPEECRNLSGTKKIECIKLYQAFYKCFESKSNLDSCALNTVGLKGRNPSEWVKECKGKKGTAMNVCKKNVMNKFLNYLKFYLYHLSFRIEAIKEQNRDKINDITDFIALVETSKQKLNKANEEEVKSILADIDNKWNNLIKSLNLPAGFNEKSGLEELKAMHDMAMNAIRNIR